MYCAVILSRSGVGLVQGTRMLSQHVETWNRGPGTYLHADGYQETSESIDATSEETAEKISAKFTAFR